MKKIYWYLFGREIIFNINYLEYLVLKRIFKNKKYEILRKEQVLGQKIDIVIIDEYKNSNKTYPK